MFYDMKAKSEAEQAVLDRPETDPLAPAHAAPDPSVARTAAVGGDGVEDVGIDDIEDVIAQGRPVFLVDDITITRKSGEGVEELTLSMDTRNRVASLIAAEMKSAPVRVVDDNGEPMSLADLSAEDIARIDALRRSS